MANIDQQNEQPKLNEWTKVIKSVNDNPDKVAKNMDISTIQKSFESTKASFTNTSDSFKKTTETFSMVEKSFKEASEKMDRFILERTGKAPQKTQQQPAVAQQQPADISSEKNYKIEDLETVKKINSLNVRWADFESRYNELINKIHDKKIIRTAGIKLNQSWYALITDRDWSYYVQKTTENVDDSKESVQSTTTKVDGTKESEQSTSTNSDAYKHLLESGITSAQMKNSGENSYNDIIDVLNKNGFDDINKINNLLSILGEFSSIIDKTFKIPPENEFNKLSWEFKTIYTTLSQKDKKIIGDILTKNNFF